MGRRLDQTFQPGEDFSAVQRGLQLENAAGF